MCRIPEAASATTGLDDTTDTHVLRSVIHELRASIKSLAASAEIACQEVERRCMADSAQRVVTRSSSPDEPNPSKNMPSRVDATVDRKNSPGLAKHSMLPGPPRPSSSSSSSSSPSPSFSVSSSSSSGLHYNCHVTPPRGLGPSSFTAAISKTSGLLLGDACSTFIHARVCHAQAHDDDVADALIPFVLRRSIDIQAFEFEPLPARPTPRRDFRLDLCRGRARGMGPAQGGPQVILLTFSRAPQRTDFLSIRGQWRTTSVQHL